MFDRLVEQFCDFDDFNTSIRTEWGATLLPDDLRGKRRGPDGGLQDCEIMTILVMYHGSLFKNFKAFYNGIILGIFHSWFPGAPCYERFLTLTKRVWILLTFFLSSRWGRKTDIYYVDSTPLPVCHNKRIAKHKMYKGLAARGKTSVGWFFGFKLHLVFNDQREIMAIRITPGNINDTVPVAELTRGLLGKLFGDKGYIGKRLAKELQQRGLELITRGKKGMPAPIIAPDDAILLDARSIAETIIGHIKEFSSLRMPKHRSVPNAFTHLTAAILAYQLNPLAPKTCLAKMVSTNP
jgi:hypothetical protein